MAERQRLEDTDKGSRNILISEADADFILRQLSTTMERAQTGRHLGSHLIKRLRRSRAIMTGCLLNGQSAASVVPPKKSLVQKLLSLLP